MLAFDAPLALHGLPDTDIAALGWAPGSEMWQLYANDPAVQRARAALINSRMDGRATLGAPQPRTTQA